MSAEMALGLRNSLTTISGYAQQLAASRDPELARQLAADIAAEAAHLDRTIGGFLAGQELRGPVRRLELTSSMLPSSVGGRTERNGAPYEEYWICFAGSRSGGHAGHTGRRAV